MSFDTPLFFVLFAVVFVLLRSLPRLGGLLLLAASVVFYSFAGPLDMMLVLAMMILNYAISFGVAKDRRWLAVAVIVNLAVLVFFKYRHFLFPGMAEEIRDFYQGEIMIPLGISFYVFQALAYQADLAYGRFPLIRSFWHFALFILFFPHMMAGPIVRASILEPQVARAYTGHLKQRRYWALGLGLCVLGLAKKVGIADSLAPHVEAVFMHGPADVFSAWLGAALFAFQIYFDFSGYSDIAVGTGYLLGFRLPINFRQPYLAIDPQGFWQRWHITLSTWIRDYVYIPLGGRRVGGNIQQMAVLLATMGLAGLWHGANWTFVLWGLFWGAYVGAWRLAAPLLEKLGRGRWLLHFTVVIILWVFFRAANVSDAFAFIGGMAGFPQGTYRLASTDTGVLLSSLGLALLLVSHVAEAWINDFKRVVRLRRWNGPFSWGLLTSLAFWFVMLPKPLANPFIYFRF
jgi:alginate O-acetyltransferase complex protein AlgI